jgi:cytosine/adenosine deaminase-related metal-dependent hydrolase
MAAESPVLALACDIADAIRHEGGRALIVGGGDGGSAEELLERCGLLDDRLIAAHCIFLDETQVARVGGSGLTVAHVPKGTAEDVDRAVAAARKVASK